MIWAFFLGDGLFTSGQPLGQVLMASIWQPSCSLGAVGAFKKQISKAHGLNDNSDKLYEIKKKHRKNYTKLTRSEKREVDQG